MQKRKTPPHKTPLHPPPPQDKIESTTPETLEIKKSSKSGVLLGIEAAISRGNGEARAFTNFTTSIYENRFSRRQINLFAGYQKYFGRKETFGLDFKIRVGLDFLKVFAIHQVSYMHGNTQSYSGPNLTFLYMPLSTGIETNLLYNILEQKKRTIGISAGVGFDFAYNFFLTANIKSDLAKPYQEFDNKNFLFLIPFAKVGAYYYYDRHQFGLQASFDNMLGGYSGGFSTPNSSNILHINFNPAITMHLSYAYRF